MADRRYSVFDGDLQVICIVGEDELAAHLREKTEAALRREVSLGADAENFSIKQAAAFSQMELDRRAAEQTKYLVRRTTWISGAVGALAALAGMVLGLWLNGGRMP